MFEVILWIIIGHVYGNLERGNLAMHDLTVNAVAKEVVSSSFYSDSRKTDKAIQNLQMKHIRSNTVPAVHCLPKEVRSDDIESVRCLLRVAMTNPSRVEMTRDMKHFGTSSTHHQIRIKPLRPKRVIIRPDFVVSNRPTSAMRFSDRKTRSARKKRSSHQKTRAMSAARLRPEKYVRTKKMGRRVKIRAANVNDFMSESKSYTLFKTKRSKLPKKLIHFIILTDGFERKLLSSFIETNSASTKLLSEYKNAKEKERNMLKKLKEKASSKEATQLTVHYKAVRKGSTWNYIKLEKKFKAFFDKPSNALKEFEKIKRDDFDSLDSFLAGSRQTKNQAEKPVHVNVESKNSRVHRNAMAIATVRTRVHKPRAEEMARGVRKREADDATDDPVSAKKNFKLFKRRLSKLPKSLSNNILATDKAEEGLLISYVTSLDSRTKPLAKYTAAKGKERETLKKLKDKASPKAAKHLVEKYKLVRQGSTWNYIKLQKRFKGFFDDPVASGEFDKIKKDDFDSLDSFLAGSSHTESQPESHDAEPNGIHNAKETPIAERVHKPSVNDGDPISVSDSLKAFKRKLSKLPKTLSDSILATDKAKERLLITYLTPNAIETEPLAKYNAAKAKEKQTLEKLKDMASPAAEKDLVAKYNSARKGGTRNYMKLQARFKGLFDNSDAKRSEKIKKAEPEAEEDEKSESTDKAEEVQNTSVDDDDDPLSVSDSLKTFERDLGKLPKALSDNILATDKAEEGLLASYVASNDTVAKPLAKYTAAKEEERKTLKKLKDKASPTEAEDLVAEYKTVRKGDTWNHIKLQDRFKAFFDDPVSLREFEKIEQDDFASLDSFLAKGEEGHKPNAHDDVDPMSVKDSLKAFVRKLFKLPKDLSNNILEADVAAERLLISYITSNGTANKLLAKYNAAKEKVRNTLKQLIAKVSPTAAADLVAKYKAVRKGSTWNYIKLQERFKPFFDDPAASREFEKIERDDFDSLDSFLALSTKTQDSTEKADAETNEIQNSEARQMADETQNLNADDHDPISVNDSLKAFKRKLTELPKALSDKIISTDKAEEGLLISYATASVPAAKALAKYTAAKEEERQTLKKLKDKASPAAAADLVAKYKAVRKGSTLNYTKLQKRLKNFFDDHVALAEFEKIKQNDFDSLDSFLAGSN